MLRDIHLHGYLGEQFGKKHKLDAHSPAEAIRGLIANYPKFRQSIHKDGEYAVVIGDKDQLTEDQLTMTFDRGDIHIVPITAGNKSGFFNIIIGVVLIAAAVFVPALAPVAWKVGIMGAAMILGGISQLMMPTPDAGGGIGGQSQMPAAVAYTQQEAPEERPSYLFNGPVNNTEQGGPVPLAYGKTWIGSITISAGIKVS